MERPLPGVAKLHNNKDPIQKMKFILPLLAVAALVSLSSCATKKADDCSGGSCCATTDAKTVKHVH